jgi:hypothetical protein
MHVKIFYGGKWGEFLAANLALVVDAYSQDKLSLVISNCPLFRTVLTTTNYLNMAKYTTQKKKHSGSER